MTDQLRAPFPWFGGKSRAASLIWSRLGDVPNYVEPFAGSLATLLMRPHDARTETVNDKDAYLSNFWRAVQRDPEAVAYYADWPVNEADLHARHRWLVTTARKRMRKVMRNPEYYDAQVAGWWVYGTCLWIGSGFCAPEGWRGRPGNRDGDVLNQTRRPQMTRQTGIAAEWAQRPSLTQKIPQMDRGGRGISGPSIIGAGGWQKRPQFKRGLAAGVHSDRVRRPNMGGRGGGQGVQSPTLVRQQIPQLSGDGSGASRGVLSDGILYASGGLISYMADLCVRLRRVRVCCGDWSRVTTPSVTTYIGLTGLVLDPPYRQDLRSICYAEDHDIAVDVRSWALEHGDDPNLRIALCGYEDEHAKEMPDTWECVPWKAHGGYARGERARENRTQERIWFSPHCIKQRDLFGALA